jgi:hypothetical protein
MALDNVQDYLDKARVLLQDTLQPYRYSDAELVSCLDEAVLETRRLRPDLVKNYFRSSLPDFDPAHLTASVPIDPQYRMAFVYYIVGQAQLRDDETTQDARASVFLNKFVSQLLSIQA